MIERKPDAKEIEAFLDGLRQASWLGPARQWWPQFVFHFAELQNAVRILEAGKLVCRSRRAMARDTGSQEVLNITADRWKDEVRLYFRPRTPTQFQIEGFRPAEQHGSLGQHMPVPIFFLFDSKDVLSRATARFSSGNLAQNPEIGGDAEFLKALPFEKIYHDSWLAEEHKGTIKFHRHAEVILPHEIDLTGLRFIWCRSEAEFQTLVQLLPPNVAKKYQPLLRAGRRPNLHFCRWSFVERAITETDRVHIEFNQSTLTPGPFAARLLVENLSNREKYQWEKGDFMAKQTLNVRITQIEKPSPYRVELTLNGDIAFAGQFEPKPVLVSLK